MFPSNQNDLEHLTLALVQQEGVLNECEALLRQALDEDGVNTDFAQRLYDYWQKSAALADWRTRDMLIAARHSSEPSEQRAIAEDVRLMGTGFAMYTAAGVKRLAPEDVTLRTRPRCLAMINEFGDKVCSLPESHGGPHVWITPEDSLKSLGEPEPCIDPGWEVRNSRIVCKGCGRSATDVIGQKSDEGASRDASPGDDLGNQIYALLVRRGYAQHEAHLIAAGPGCTSDCVQKGYPEIDCPEHGKRT